MLISPSSLTLNEAYHVCGGGWCLLLLGKAEVLIRRVPKEVVVQFVTKVQVMDLLFAQLAEVPGMGRAWPLGYDNSSFHSNFFLSSR